MRRRLLVLALVLPAAACSGFRPEPPKAPPAISVNSPNGEPLPFKAGQDDCRGALSAWFSRADRNGDGVIDQAEYLADAERWFDQADLDHDGQITPDELAAIRSQLLPQPEQPAEPDPEQARRSRSMATLRHTNARVDPVMEADANADFRVTRAEFRAYSTELFNARQRGGVIRPDQVLDACSRLRD